MGEYLWRVKTDEKIIYLTFDDGPTPDVTPWVLEQLSAYGAKATFFMVGEQVKKFPELAHEV
ncbi:MAG: polysaccharide deacetylase family protein, partial [Bacteroidota bacterium]